MTDTEIRFLDKLRKRQEDRHRAGNLLLKRLEHETCDLRCVQSGDDSYHWEVIEHWMAEPTERTIGAGETVEQALRDAFDKPSERVDATGSMVRELLESHTRQCETVLCQAFKARFGRDLTVDIHPRPERQRITTQRLEVYSWKGVPFLELHDPVQPADSYFWRPEDGRNVMTIRSAYRAL